MRPRRKFFNLLQVIYQRGTIAGKLNQYPYFYVCKYLNYINEREVWNVGSKIAGLAVYCLFSKPEN